MHTYIIKFIITITFHAVPITKLEVAKGRYQSHSILWSGLVVLKFERYDVSASPEVMLEHGLLGHTPEFPIQQMNQNEAYSFSGVCLRI